MRKSIFDIVADSYDIKMEIVRLINLTINEKVLCVSYKEYSLFDFVDEYCFKYWQYRGHCIDVKDYLRTIEYETMLEQAVDNIEAFLTVIETIYNFWELSHNEFTDERLHLKWKGNYFHIKDVLDDNLERLNHTAYINKEHDKVLVIEDKPQVTAATECVKEELSLEVIRYNHRSLLGELDEKKRILLAFAADLEPRRKEIAEIDKTLEDDIFFMLNNLNIRHNNRSKNDKNYKKYVANMRKATLEKWYDELYQMILLAYLKLEQKGRKVKIKELKQKIVESK